MRFKEWLQTEVLARMAARIGRPVTPFIIGGFLNASLGDAPKKRRKKKKKKK